MKVMTEQDPRFVKIERKIGLFVAVALLSMLSILLFTLIKEDLFEKKFQLYLKVDNGRDIATGMAVKLSGFKIGRVRQVSLDDIAQVRVELDIRDHYMQWIRIDSRAVLVKEGLLGDSIIEIMPGTMRKAMVTTGDTIAFEREKGLVAIADDVKEDLKLLLADVRRAIGHINNPEGELQQAVANIAQLTRDLQTLLQQVSTLMAGVDQDRSGLVAGLEQVLGKMARLAETGEQRLAQLDTGLNAGTKLVTQLSADLPALTQTLQQSLDDIARLTEILVTSAEASGPKVPVLLEESLELAKEGRHIVKSGNEAVDALKKTWPLRTQIKIHQPLRIQGDSYE